MKIKIITGLSGSGKTSALRTYEDLGFYAMDNVPAYLLEKFIDLNKDADKPIEKMAVVMDYRCYPNTSDMEKSLLSLKKLNEDTEIIFISSSDDVIYKRYNELRRPHPLGEYGDVVKGLEKEKILLRPIRKISDRFIDTSNYNIAELKKVIEDSIDKKDRLIVNLISFGFKYGLDDNFDFVFDTRFIKNPYYEKELRNLNGTDKKLQEFLDKFDIVDDFIIKITYLMRELIPAFNTQGKNNITLAIGCTGGCHRSVYIVERLYEALKDDGYILIKKHREKDKW